MWTNPGSSIDEKETTGSYIKGTMNLQVLTSRCCHCQFAISVSWIAFCTPMLSKPLTSSEEMYTLKNPIKPSSRYELHPHSMGGSYGWQHYISVWQKWHQVKLDNKILTWFLVWLWLLLDIKVLSSSQVQSAIRTTLNMDFRKFFPPWFHITAQQDLQHYIHYWRNESTLHWNTLDAPLHNWAQKRYPIKEDEKKNPKTAQQNLSVCLRTPVYWLLKHQLQWILLFRWFWKYIWNIIC